MNKEYLLRIIQFVTLYNAIILGWDIKQIGDNQFELSKKIRNYNDFDFSNFLETIIPISIKNET